MIYDLQSTFKFQFYSVINKNYKIHMELNKQTGSHCHMDIYQLSVISTNNNNNNKIIYSRVSSRENIK